MPATTISSPSYPFPPEIVECITRWCKEDPGVLAACSQVNSLWCQEALPKLYRTSWSYVKFFKTPRDRSLRAQRLMETLLRSLVNHVSTTRRKKIHKVFSRLVHQFEAHSNSRKLPRPLAIEYFCLVRDFDLSLIESALKRVDSNIIRAAGLTSLKSIEANLRWYLNTFRDKCVGVESFVATELPSFCLEEVIPSLQNYQQLSHLELYSTDSAQPINGSHLALIALACHQLQEIKIVNPAHLSSWLRTITDEDIALVITSQKTNTLRKIHLEGLVMVPLKATLNSLKLQHLDSFCSLTLKQCKFPERTGFTTLGDFPKFACLEFIHCEELTDKMIFGAAKRCTRLRTLNLSGCCSVSFSTIAEFVQSSEFLMRQLAFKGIQYHIEDASLLLSKCSRLKSLTLGSNASAQQEFQSFISGLLKSCTLTQLDLGLAAFDLASAQQFYQFPKLSTVTFKTNSKTRYTLTYA